MGLVRQVAAEVAEAVREAAVGVVELLLQAERRGPAVVELQAQQEQVAEPRVPLELQPQAEPRHCPLPQITPVGMRSQP